MEFIRGVKLTDMEAIDAAHLDRKALAEATLRAMIKQLLVDGFFHGDPHPGNVFVNLDTGIVTFLDTGMVGDLSVKQRMNLVNMMVVMQDRDVRGLARVMYRVSQPTKPVDERAYYRDFERQVGRYIEPDRKVMLVDVLKPAFDVLMAHGLRLDSQLTLALKAVMQADAIGRALFPGTNVGEMALAVTIEMAVDEIHADRLVRAARREVSYTLGEVVERLPTLQEATLKWLDQYQKGQLQLRLDTSDLSKNVREARGIVIQVTIGVLLVGMIIGSAIAADITATRDFVWPILPDLPLLGYVISMIVAGIFVIRLILQLIRGGKDE